jgi:hypothetical protein
MAVGAREARAQWDGANDTFGGTNYHTAGTPANLGSSTGKRGGFVAFEIHEDEDNSGCLRADIFGGGSYSGGPADKELYEYPYTASGGSTSCTTSGYWVSEGHDNVGVRRPVEIIGRLMEIARVPERLLPHDVRSG